MRSRRTTHAPATVARRLVYRSLYSLPAPVRDPAYALLGRRELVLLGGLNAADVSTAGIEVADERRLLRSAALPLAQHDAQAAALNGLVYVFGGGGAIELDHIISFNAARGIVRQVGRLPHAQSDVAVAATGGIAYIVGGYDGSSWLNTILAWRPGAAAKVVGHLPVGLRYAAASAVSGQVVILGGSTPTGASTAIYRFDPRTGSVRPIGRLPRPITHATAATLGGFVYLVGGRGDDLESQTAEVLAVDPRSGAVRRAGRLPQPLSDAAVVSTGHRLVVAGGLTPAGTQAQVGELTAAG